MSQDPTRLFENPATPEELKKDLTKARAEGALAFDLDAGLARFDAGIDPGPASAGAAGVSGVLKISLAVVGALVLGALLWAPWESEPLEPATAPSVEAPSGEPEVEQADEGLAAPTEPLPESTPEVAPSEEPLQVVEAHPAPVAPQPSPAQELQLMAETRAALRTNPQRAMSLLRRGDREFPRGVFVQERRAYHVLALAQLGQSAAARRAAERFVRRYPASPLRERVVTAAGLSREDIGVNP